MTRRPFSGLEQTWRWFGPQDPVTLREIRQAGAEGIVTALHHVPVGEVWTTVEIAKRQALLAEHGLPWSVAESLPVHEDIKKRAGQYRRWIDNYKVSLRNLGHSGVDTVCYNFMPVLDWLRTDLRVVCDDGAITTKFEADVFAAFDLFILRRGGAEGDHPAGRVEKARRLYEAMTGAQRDALAQTVLLGLPGSLEAFSLDGLRSAIEGYADLGTADLRENLREFVREIVPVAEEAGVRLAIHADDPPWAVLGLPRVVTDSRDIESILSAHDSPANGLTFCTGSFGAKASNNLVAMAGQFAQRISFVHLRNVSRNDEGDFREEDHLDGDVDMASLMRILVLEQHRREVEGRRDRRLPFRPDHGRLMTPDMDRIGVYPGYSLFGRMRGLAELRGLELGIRRSLGW